VALKSYGDGPVIDAVILSDKRQALPPPKPLKRGLPARYKPATRASAVGLAMALATLAVAAGGVGFRTEIAGILAGTSDGGRYQGLEFGPVQTEIQRGRTLLVNGTVVNRTNDVMALPAIRLAFRTDGNEIYSWSVEPTARTIAAGETIAFRSMVAAPGPAEGEVIVSLVSRQNDVVGLR
jgi:hypothetical protein